ncbi:DUF3618 domain-containing protein [Catenuloplanes atrovinosus]|uniref:Cobalamin biosynthesis Mg chelatase CobN n=1 Tax=Catenuloplanes atrovinosus TaxID=137266 RepID=A0AAE3YLJ6_9ACTN|nr:DUF3618 domain-containing protein [Catenuloplanes atrovinosus]MDR7274071.1 cobalamin biosynthesis Mg chelatase CobN [Catenuloplanes atrovinosus]
MTMEDVRKNDGSSQDLDALRAEIERTRAELGDTVQALAAKADVKARAKEQVEQAKANLALRVQDAKETVSQRAHEAADVVSVRAHEVSVRAHDAGEAVRRNPVPAAAIAAATAAALVLALWLIRRRR